MAAVELMVLELPTLRPDPAVVAALTESVEQGQITVLDLVFLARGEDGTVRVVDVAEELGPHGVGTHGAGRDVLLSEAALDTVRTALTPGTSAAAVVYEPTWSRRLVAAVGAAGGRVTLHAVRGPEQLRGEEQPSASPAGGPAGPDLVDQLAELADLHTSGALTDAEFRTAKAQLLA